MINDVKTLLSHARTHGLNLVSSQKELDQSGLDFLVLHGEDESKVPWIVRTPRHPNAFKGTINEAKVLSLLRSRISVAVPHWKIHEPSMIAYPKLPGTPTWSFDPEQGVIWNGLDASHPQENFMHSSAKFLTKLHSVDPELVRSIGGKVRTISEVRASLLNACESTRDTLNPRPDTWLRWMKWIHDDSYWPQEGALVHGDFHPGHMLLDETLTLTGVLDWTEAEVADPSVDFGIFYGCFGQETLERFLQLYKAGGGKTHTRMKEHIIERWAAYPALVAKWAIDNNNPGVLEHAKGHLATAEAKATQDEA